MDALISFFPSLFFLFASVSPARVCLSMPFSSSMNSSFSSFFVCVALCFLSPSFFSAFALFQLFAHLCRVVCLCVAIVRLIISAVGCPAIALASAAILPF